MHTAIEKHPYRHSDHAGNYGDVVKHAVLVAVLDELLKSLGSEAMIFCDAFSGGGEYHLGKGGERPLGVETLREKATAQGQPLPRVASYLEACWSLDGKADTYPGSSLTAARRAAVAKKPIVIRAWDTNHDCISDLQYVLSRKASDAHVEAVGGAMPPGAADKADLLFVDPPQREGWDTTVENILSEGSPPRSLLVWLPIDESEQIASSWQPITTTAVPQGVKSQLCSIEVLWATPTSAQQMVGCELLLALPQEAHQAAVDTAEEVTQTMGRGWSMKLRRLPFLGGALPPSGGG
jgi:23S rRNA (adenine2030-N6)-methyltransferase